MPKRVSLFQILRRELGQQIAAEGFTEIPQDASSRTNTLLYFREPSRGKSLGFWFQRDVKALYVDAVGSALNLEFFRSLEDRFNMRRRKRAFFLYTPGEREEMRALQNQMIGRLPPLASIFAPWEIKVRGEFLERCRQMVQEPFSPSTDVWMRYRDEADIVAWTSFIGRLLPALVERFDAALPEQP